MYLDTSQGGIEVPLLSHSKDATISHMKIHLNTVISILLPDLRGGGAERVMLDLAHEFVRLGHKVEFVLMRADGDFLPEALKHFAVTDLSSQRTRFLVFKLTSYLRKRKPDAVIANMWPLTSAAVVANCLAGRACPLLLVEHNTLSKQYANWGALHPLLLASTVLATYRFADKIAAVSEGSGKDIAQIAKLALDRVHVLHNPIPQRPSPSSEARAKVETLWNCPPGDRILSVGTLKEQKNQPLLLEAFAKMGGPEARLMFLGKGDAEMALREQAQALGIADRVVFAGFHPDPAPFYATADLFALSSDYEGLPTVLIEALSFGLPIVSTDCPFGPAEILENGHFGCLVPVGDAEALARAMEAALHL
ncbi:MAG: glycosyltransferase, partial [Pseudomonadota bacterium]